MMRSLGSCRLAITIVCRTTTGDDTVNREDVIEYTPPTYRTISNTPRIPLLYATRMKHLVTFQSADNLIILDFFQTNRTLILISTVLRHRDSL